MSEIEAGAGRAKAEAVKTVAPNSGVFVILEPNGT